MPIETYFKSLNANIVHGDYTEMTHRKAFGNLLDEMLPSAKAFEETGNKNGNKPDYIVEKDKTPLGFIETKDLKADLDKLEKDNQLRRYFEAVGNVITTNYLEFRWYLKQENSSSSDKNKLSPVCTLSIGSIVDNKIKIEPDAETSLKQLLKNFVEAQVKSVKEPKELASRLSSIAILIRNSISAVFADEELKNEKVVLESQLNAFKENLISDLEPEQFADMYAQTICYGLFSAKISLDTKPLSWESASSKLPNTNPFLKKVFNEFTQELPESVKKHVDLVVNLLNHADLESVLSGFGRGTGREDPIFHFYETFLYEYNPKEKELRGEYYTPEPVVSYIVRSVDMILKEKFGMKSGLADSTEIETDKGKFKKLTILDPATGTGTFLYSALNKIFDNLGYGKLGKLGKADIETIDKDILSRIYGFELKMAPYTIAHMKLGLLLQDKGYEGSNRIHIYLTNTLDRHHEKIEKLPGGGFDRVIAIESMEASKAKTSLPIMVVIGNPPYSGHSANKIPWMDRLMRGQDDTVPGFHETLENTANYFKVDGKDLKEAQVKWLHDDYVKFIRWGQWRIEKTGAGVLAFITNHGYLDNPTFRGMRQSLLETFDEIYVLDLHGNAKKKEACSDGSKDENVFDIQQGVAIGLFVKTGKEKQPHPSPLLKGEGEPNKSSPCGRGEGEGVSDCKVFHADLYGLREDSKKDGTTIQGKYNWLLDNDIRKTEWKQVNPAKPFYMFIHQESSYKEQYDEYTKITDLFIVNGVGMTTARDDMVIDFSSKPIIERVKTFKDSTDTNTQLCKQLNISEKLGWNVTNSRQMLKNESDLQQYIKPLLYRPFDERLIFYHDSLVWRTVKQIMRHMLAGENLGISVGRAGQVIDDNDWNIVFCSKYITEFNLYRRGGNNLFPLYLYPDPNPAKLNFETSPWPEGKNGRRPNLDKKIVDTIASDLGITFIPDGKGNITILPPPGEGGRRASAQPSPTGRRCPEGTDEGVVNPSKQPHPNPLLKGEGAITFGPEDLFNYIYAVLHSPTYRTRYADFLKYDFPRVPFVKDPELFRELAILGQKLSSLHLLEDPELDDFNVTYIGDGENIVESVTFENGKVKINKTQYFEGIPQNVWEFMVGGYQVAQKWLKDRKGRTLSHEDRLTYAKIMTALAKTLEIMIEIDAFSNRLFCDLGS